MSRHLQIEFVQTDQSKEQKDKDKDSRASHDLWRARKDNDNCHSCTTPGEGRWNEGAVTGE